jgi:fatty-acyl-CoA synthase
MRGKLIEQTASAYGYPLLIKELLRSGVNRAPEQEIVCGLGRRMLYRELAERVGRLASGLAGLGVGPGHTVGVMDWDSTRYLECYFAVPIMGAVLHTINVRLSPEQILYTINLAEDDVILVNSEFLPLVAQIWERWSLVRKAQYRDDVPLQYRGDTPASSGVPGGAPWQCCR